MVKWAGSGLSNREKEPECCDRVCTLYSAESLDTKIGVIALSTPADHSSRHIIVSTPIFFRAHKFSLFRSLLTRRTKNEKRSVSHIHPTPQVLIPHNDTKKRENHTNKNILLQCRVVVVVAIAIPLVP